jgi:GNAT superfamily N-acetyltransferase
MKQAQTDSLAIRNGLEENLWAMWSRFGKGEGCTLHTDQGALWFETPIPRLPYNSVIRFAVEENVDPRIDQIFETYRSRNVPFIWIVHPSARPTDIEQRLRARGFEEVELCHGMWMDLTRLTDEIALPDGFVVREVSQGRDVESLLDLVFWRWDVPGEYGGQLRKIAQAFEFGARGSAVRSWIAWKDGVPVSKVVLNCAAESAGVYGVATKPEARRFGLGRMLTLKALAAARRDGYKLGVLHSSELAKRLYESMGFRTFAPFRIFAIPNSFHV